MSADLFAQYLCILKQWPCLFSTEKDAERAETFYLSAIKCINSSHLTAVNHGFPGMTSHVDRCLWRHHMKPMIHTHYWHNKDKNNHLGPPQISLWYLQSKMSSFSYGVFFIWLSGTIQYIKSLYYIRWMFHLGVEGQGFCLWGRGPDFLGMVKGVKQFFRALKAHPPTHRIAFLERIEKPVRKNGPPLT